MKNEKQFNEHNIKNAPKENGVYIFYDKDKSVLYVGKAKNIRSRISSYKLGTVTGKTLKLVNKTRYFSYIVVNSDIEALLLEAKLVKKYQPKYNTQLKDDKHPLYIRITNEDFPRVITARRKDEINEGDDLFGPFPSSRNVRSVLEILRRIFPYSQHKQKVGKPCFYNQIGLCDPCPNQAKDVNNKEDIKSRYNYNIKMIRGILDNRFNFVKKDLHKEMREYAKNEKFEDAQRIKKKINTLEYITQSKVPPSSFLKNPNLVEDIRIQELDELENFLNDYLEIKDIRRIECYDVAHLQGSEPTASMVTFVDGEPEKELYRRFKIRQDKGSDDVASLKEVAQRRIKHLADWGVPDLIIVDGGKGQVGVFNDIFKEQKIPVIGLAKKFESVVIPNKNGRGNYTVRKVPKGNALNLVKRLRDEAHRFARSYHHKLLEKMLIPND